MPAILFMSTLKSIVVFNQKQNYLDVDYADRKGKEFSVDFGAL